MHPLVNAQGQLCDLVAAEVEASQAGEGVQALRHPCQVVAGQVHICGTGWGASAGAQGSQSSLEAQLHHLQAVWLLASDLISLSLRRDSL